MGIHVIEILAPGISEVVGGISEATANTLYPAKVATEAAIARLDGQFVNVRKHGAVGDGTTDDTTAIAAAFTAADTSPRKPVYFPPGTYLTSAINYRGQSIIGGGSQNTIIKGKSSQDVLHLDPALGLLDREGMVLCGFTVLVNDTVNATASFPQRGGVGNAGFAVDRANGAAADVLMMRMSEWADLTFKGSGQVTNGQNSSCGIYTQFQTINLASLDKITFDRLRYGWWDHYPTSNPTSSENARDHVRIGWVYFAYCGFPWRIVNGADWEVGTVTVHNCEGPGITFHGFTSSIRLNCTALNFGNVMIEDGDAAAFEFTGNASQNISIDTLDTAATLISTWGANYSRIRNWRLHVTSEPVAVLNVTGNQNDIEVAVGGGVNAAYLYDSITDTGSGNRITMVSQSSNLLAQRISQRLSRGVAERHVPDAASLLIGHTDPMFVSGNDLMIHPYQMWSDQGYTLNTDYSFVTDATSDYGVVLRHLVTGHVIWGDNGFNGLRGFRVGKFLPPGRVRVYVKVKATSAGTHSFGVWDSAANDMGSASFNLTTSYAVYAFDIDLSAEPVDELLRFYSQSTASIRPVDIAWVALRPFARDVLLDGAQLIKNIAATPGTPTVGGVLYVESGALKYKGSSGTVTTLGVA